MASLSKTLAATPPMGWNSWNMFGNAIHEASIRETADALVSLGLKDCGSNMSSSTTVGRRRTGATAMTTSYLIRISFPTA